MTIRIAPNAEPIAHHPIHKPIDIRYPGRRRVVTQLEILDNLVRQPDPAIYEQNFHGNWVLKD
jgi:hypothetical protein